MNTTLDKATGRLIALARLQADDPDPTYWLPKLREAVAEYDAVIQASMDSLGHVLGEINRDRASR